MGGSDMVKISSKITGVSLKSVPRLVVSNPAPGAAPEAAPIRMNEKVARPDALEGKTYKIKPVTIDSAIYVTINNVTLPSGEVRPYEIFINTKDITAIQWMTAMTLLISAVFRKGGDCTFLVEEMKSVFDPQGGYFGKNGVYHPSVVSEIGEVIKDHLTSLGMLKVPEVKKPTTEINAHFCPKCREKSLVVLDGCNTCLSCAYSKCG